MISRERVWRAIHFQGPDRLPHFLPDGGENDLLWLWLPRPGDREPWTDLPDGRRRRVDAWGVTWETMGGGSFGEAMAWPISDIARQTDYAFPEMHRPEYFTGAAETIRTNDASDNPKYCLGVLPFNSLHEGTHNIMGLERMFAAYYEAPEALAALIGRMAAAQRASMRRLAEIGCDGVMGYDDWGLQDRLMVSPALFEEVFLPHYRENWALAHQLGLDVWMHSCGCTLELLPTFADAGLTVIQMDQQENMGLEALDARIGGRLAFWCPVDIQQTMVHGSLADIEAYVCRMIATLGGHNGGLVSMAYSSPDAVQHPPEKTAAMCRAFRTYGVY